MEELLKRLATFIKGDPAVANINALLKVPGTFNHKHDPPRLMQIVERAHAAALPFDAWVAT